MKQGFHSSALILALLLLLLFCSKISSRSIANKQGQVEVKLNEIASGDSFADLEGSESMNQLMGMENCNEGNEECLKRRVLSEAHLDYIYTQQHHKP
ncbi:putative phytosulfokines 6 [Castanea sativa]|uniref:putative phytosulfokines 6 n=1 Tax=Castanea sativa TaxID=21020 RepID=UPI003F653A8E